MVKNLGVCYNDADRQLGSVAACWVNIAIKGAGRERYEKDFYCGR